MHLVLFFLILGSGLPFTTGQAPETSTPIDPSSTEAGTTDVEQVSITAPDSTLSPDPGSNSTYLNSTHSADSTTPSNDSNATDSSMGVTAIYTPTMTPVTISSTPPATTKRCVQTTKPPSPDKGDNTVIVIIIVIIFAAVIIGTLCIISRKRSRRYSVDLRSRNQEEAEVPLSTMEAEGAADSSSRNGLQTFSGPTAEAKDSTPVTDAKKEPEEKGENLGSSSSEIHQDDQA